MRTWLADQEAFCPWCESWVVPAAAWAIDPAVVVRDDDSLDAILSGELRMVTYKIPENERRWDVEHYPGVDRKHHFVGTLRLCGLRHDLCPLGRTRRGGVMTAAPDERVERAAVALVDALGQDWPIEQPTWKPETVEHWRGYKASWREAASMVLAAADNPAVAPNLCGVCGSNMKRAVGGQCVQAMYHPTDDQSS